MNHLDKMHEECALFGFINKKSLPACEYLNKGLADLQHRGQEASGFCVSNQNHISVYKLAGHVNEVFKSIKDPTLYNGEIGIGHNRYSTTGGKSRRNIQPFFITNAENKITLALAHNGNLTNTKELREKLQHENVKFVSNGSDSEAILLLINQYLHLGIIEAIRKTYQHISGAFSVLVLHDGAIYAFKDQYSIRPLCIGQDKNGTIYVSSEDSALFSLKAAFIREVEKNEIVKLTPGKIESFKALSEYENRQRSFCSFEHIYFARPDSSFYGQGVYQVREYIGKKLYEQMPVEADIVTGVPDSGTPAAIGYSLASNIPYKPFIVKNKYQGGRSFIEPNKKSRKNILGKKHNFIRSEIERKRIVVIDDSMVRGTTMQILCKNLKKFSPAKIHIKIASPQIIAPCFLGIDTPKKQDLISATNSIEKIRRKLGVDSLDFITLENLQSILKQDKHCFGCMNEQYPTNT